MKTIASILALSLASCVTAVSTDKEGNVTKTTSFLSSDAQVSAVAQAAGAIGAAAVTAEIDKASKK